MNKNQVNIVSHSLGINFYNALLSTQKKDKFLPDEFYRNYYNYGEFSDDMSQLENMGFITKTSPLNLTCFMVTDKGISEFREIFKVQITDTFVPLSRAKQKYDDYLRSDCGLTFAEYNGIWVPKREYKEGLVKLVSTKYPDVKGYFAKTIKDAKVSYKKALRIKKLSNQ